MSTVNKLSYLNDTKSLLRTSLNKFGSSILSTDTFRSYDTKLNEIYDKLPKVTATGQGLTISNVQNGLLDDFKMNGVDLEQDTTTGKNLFKASSSNYPQGLNITYDSDKGTITFSGTTTGTYPTLSNFTEANIPAGTYTFSIDKALPYNLSCRFRNSSGEYPSTVIISAGELSKSITLSYDTVRLELVYSVTNVGVTIPTTTIKPMVEPGSTATNWEKYSGGNPAPNPNYPQQIKVVEGRQTITDKGKNLFDVSQTPHSNSLPGVGVITTINNDGTISTSGTNSATYRNIRYDIQLPAGEYIISGCPAGGSKNGYSSLVQLTEETSSQVFDTGSGATFSLQETTTVKFYPVRVGSETVNFNDLIFKPMIRLSNISNDTFEPYHEPVDYNIDLSLENIQLAKMPNTDYKNRIYKNNGNWYYEKNIEKIILDGNATWYKYNNNFVLETITNYNRVTNIPICTHFKGIDMTIGTSISIEDNDKTIRFGNNENHTFRLFIIDSDFSDAGVLKNFLLTHNVELWYILATPTTTQITNTTLINQLEAISTFKGTNIFTISNDNNVIPEIEITRLKELEKLS